MYNYKEWDVLIVPRISQKLREIQEKVLCCRFSWRKKQYNGFWVKGITMSGQSHDTYICMGKEKGS